MQRGPRWDALAAMQNLCAKAAVRSDIWRCWMAQNGKGKETQRRRSEKTRKDAADRPRLSRREHAPCGGLHAGESGGRTGGGEACEAANHDHDADSLRSPSGCIILGFDINCLRNLTICLHRSAA